MGPDDANHQVRCSKHGQITRYLPLRQAIHEALLHGLYDHDTEERAFSITVERVPQHDEEG